MFALGTTCLLLAYVLLPAALFRVVFASFVRLKKSPRTRAEEVTFAALVAVVPLQLARWAAFGGAPSLGLHLSDVTAGDLRVALSTLAGAALDPPFWESLGRLLALQRRFLAWFYPAVAVEALLLGLLGRHYGTLQAALARAAPRWPRAARVGRAALEVAGARLLFPGISEWDALFTPSLFVPRRERASAHVDVLTSDNHLYRGQVAEYFLDGEGRLRGLYLTRAQRFQRDRYVAACIGRAERPAADPFWRDIGGHQLYVDAAKVGTINVRFVPDPRLAIAPGPDGGIAVEVVGSSAEPG
jgi:hypothetical protein